MELTADTSDYFQILNGDWIHRPTITSQISVIGMKIFPDIGQYYFELVLVQFLHYLELVFFVVLKETILHSEVVPHQHSHYHGRVGSFFITGFDGSACSQFALGEIDNTNLFSSLYFLNYGS